uniref:NAC domain-containing protein n=1 Tax=Davidia involucrata TaxID=16924 RepID=A0A5B6ZRH8_DAVIN
MYNLPKTTKNEWVICRIFQKSSDGKKINVSGLVRMTSYADESRPSNLPPLMDCSAYDHDQTRSTTGDTSHVTCFSNPMEDKEPHKDMVDTFNSTTLLASSSSSKSSDLSPASLHFPKVSVPNSFFSTQNMPNIENMQFQDSFLTQDQSILSIFLQNKRNLSTEMGQMSYEDPITSAGPVDLDCLWNY